MHHRETLRPGQLPRRRPVCSQRSHHMHLADAAGILQARRCHIRAFAHASRRLLASRGCCTYRHQMWLRPCSMQAAFAPSDMGQAALFCTVKAQIYIRRQCAVRHSHSISRHIAARQAAAHHHLPHTAAQLWLAQTGLDHCTAVRRSMPSVFTGDSSDGGACVTCMTAWSRCWQQTTFASTGSGEDHHVMTRTRLSASCQHDIGGMQCGRHSGEDV